MKEVYKYDAFISYSHTEDNTLAPAIQAALQKIKAPWHGLSNPIINVFRDATNLGKAPGNLSDSIKEGIRKSHKFILLCSPKAKDSLWVNQEVDYFKELCQERKVNPCEKIIIIVTHGNIKWSYEKNDWDWQNTDIVPKSLYGLYSDEPLWVDLKDVKKETNLDTKSSIFKNGIIRIAAFLLDKEPAEIDSIELRTRRTQKQIITGVIVALIVMFGVSTSMYFVAISNEERAITEQQRAEVNAKRAIQEQERAVREQERAEINADSAFQAKIRAEVNAKRAIREQERAVREQERAEANGKRALQEQERAEANAMRAEANAKRAIQEQERAENSALRTDSLNKVLLAENLAITSLTLSDSSENKAIKASELFKSYSSKDPKHLAKRAIIYNSLYNAYQNKLHTLDKITTNFEIEKVSYSGEAMGIQEPVDKYFVYTMQYVPEINLSIKSLEKSTIYIGSVKQENFSSVTASDYIKGNSLLLTGHDDGKVVSWKYMDQDKIKYSSTIYDLPDKVLWLSHINDNLILTATRKALYLLSNRGELNTLCTFEKDNSPPTALDYSSEDDLLFIGFQDGNIKFFKIEANKANTAYTLEKLPPINYDRDTKDVSTGKVSSPINIIKYDSMLKTVAFSTNSGKLILFHVDPKGSTLNHYEIVGIKYQQPIKDILLNRGWITVALKSKVIKWPVSKELLYQVLTSNSKEKLSVK